MSKRSALHQSRKHRAMQHFAMGVLAERRQRYLDAVEHFSAAVELDPQAVRPRTALLPLYLALDRHADALALARKILDLAPNDHETWYLYSRQLAMQGAKAEALTALAHTVGLPSIRRDPEILMHASLDLARMLEDTGDLERAAGMLTKTAHTLEQENPHLKPVEVYIRLGHVHAKTENTEQAIAAYRRAQALLGEEDAVLARRLDYELARVLDLHGKAAEALASLDRFLLTLPPGTDAYEFKVRILEQAGRGDEVLPTLEAASARDSNNGALRLLLASQYCKQGQLRDGERVYLALVAESPATEVYLGLFRLYRTEGRMSEALRLLNSAMADSDIEQRRARAIFGAVRDDMELSAELVTAVREFGRPDLHAATRRLLASMAFQCRQLDVAEELYRACLHDDASRRLRALMYDGLLRTLWAAGKHQAVVEVCRKGLLDADGPIQRFPFHGNLARALVILGKPKDALAEADRAIEASDAGNRLACQLLRVEILALARDYTRAEADCQELLNEAAPPSDARRIRHVLSNVYTAARDYAKAEAQLRLILRDDPDDATANNDLGYIMADQGGNLDEAEKLIRKALAIDEKRRQSTRLPDDDDRAANAAFVDSLGWVLFRKGRFVEAKHELERAVALPDGARDPVVWDHLGDVYLRLGDVGQTRSAWDTARTLYETEKRRALDDQYKELKRKLKQLSSQVGQRGFFDFGSWVFDWVKR